MNNKPKVLIVDDVSSNIHFLVSILKDKYQISAATNGEKAIEIVKNGLKPDIILLDIVMPTLDGYEVCRILKEDKKYADIPIVFITSLSSSLDYEKGIKVGGSDFLAKPFSKEQVEQKIERFLKKDQKRSNLSGFDYLESGKAMKEEKKKVLVVDDSPENIQVMIEVLKKEYTLSVSTSGSKALELLYDGLEPDLILLDVIMPEMDGYELCEKIKADVNFKNIPIIFVTILEHEQDVVRGFELGAVDYVIKPIEPIVLKARINTHLKLKSFQDKLMDDIRKRDDLLLKQSKLAVLGEMFENITHQWKQPLSSIRVSTTGIKLEKEHNILTDEKLMNFLDTIDLSVNHLNQTIDDFKNFLVQDTQKHRFSLKTIVNKTIKLLQTRFKLENITIEANLSDVEIINYQNDLIQVLMNILSNAYEALRNNTSEKVIKIGFDKSETYDIIKVEDNGGGISQSNLQYIFKKYFSTKKNKEGSGVGLYMCKKIVEDRLGGKIEVSNNKEGACFSIALPSLSK